MTVAGDLGSAPMVKVGAQAPLRRKKPLKKQGKNKMTNFKDYMKDSVAEKAGVDVNLDKEYKAFWDASKALTDKIDKIDKTTSKQLSKVFNDVADILDVLQSED